MDKHIIAIGGGGFGRSVGNLKIEKYIVSLSNSKKPNIAFIPTASGDNDAYKVSFYNAFTRIGCKPSHLDFFKRTVDLEDYIQEQDIIYIGGGNTKSMLGIWREWNLCPILQNAYNNGVIMSGVSAGAICWFSKGITDSYQKRLTILDCLDFVDGICCPHYDEEKDRTPYVEKLIREKKINSCIAIEGSSALHLKNGKPFRSLNFGDSKNTYSISLVDNDIVNKPFKSLDL